MKRHFRGSNINFEAVFTSTAGVVQQVTAATLTIQAPLDGFPHFNGSHTTSFSMTNTSTVTGTWEYNWDSTPSAAGTVWWNIQPASTAGKSKSGRFEILSNPAATWVHAPSSLAANDEQYGAETSS
jgi:hypothetical protein